MGDTVLASEFTGARKPERRPDPDVMIQSDRNTLLGRSNDGEPVRIVDRTVRALRPDGVTVTFVPGDLWPEDTTNWTLDFAVDWA